METIRIERGMEVTAARRAAAVLEVGGVVVFPAERFYGLAADATRPEAVRKVFALKERRLDLALPVIVADEMMARAWAAVPAAAEGLIRKFWPGPLTVVLPCRGQLPEEVTAGESLAVRVPGNLLAREIPRQLGRPITATSANQSGQPPACLPEEAVAFLNGKPDLVLDAGPLPGPPASTIIKVSETSLEILRRGIIPQEQILAVFGAKA